MAKNDDTIKALLATIETQTIALGTPPRGTWLTNGVFKFHKDDYFNINVTTDPSQFARAMGYILAQKKEAMDGAAALGIAVDFAWSGYSVEEWLADFKTRIAIIEYNKKKTLLNATKAKLKTLVSEKARTEMELEEIAKALKEV